MSDFESVDIDGSPQGLLSVPCPPPPVPLRRSTCLGSSHVHPFPSSQLRRSTAEVTQHPLRPARLQCQSPLSQSPQHLKLPHQCRASPFRSYPFRSYHPWTHFNVLLRPLPNTDRTSLLSLRRQLSPFPLLSLTLSLVLGPSHRHSPPQTPSRAPL
ncbi:hypothetical protein CRENBAI_013025 [Crenichthys baileyi]|uniref:Uncharacterized protein n=1 Tax=Crenichthys baileyi TaxID=28760 RepID=A0AAV9SQD5_9TELE